MRITAIAAAGLIQIDLAAWLNSLCHMKRPSFNFGERDPQEELSHQVDNNAQMNVKLS